MSCCGNDSDVPKWKREVIQDHKFDFVDVDEFYDTSFFTRISYALVFMVVIKSTLVYMADLWTAVSLLVINHMAITPAIPIEYTRWIFIGCIILSFLLLALDIRKARMIIASRDISYAFTSVIASRYYILRGDGYSHYCFFNKIHNSKKTADEVAFFVFFTLKGWKRLLFADAPRAVINSVTLFPTIRLVWVNWVEDWHDGPVGSEDCPYDDEKCLDAQMDKLIKTNWQLKILMGTMAFSLVLFIISAVMVLIASIMYIPLLCHIRGNLKEYCCHKIDKRIAELLKRQAKKRVLQAREKDLKNKKAALKGHDIEMNDMVAKPTLPQVEVLDDYNRPMSVAGYSDPYSKTPLMTERGYGSPASAYASPHPGYQQSPFMAHPMPDGSYEYHKSQEHMYKDSNFEVMDDYLLGNEQGGYAYATAGPEYDDYQNNNYSPSPVMDRRLVQNTNEDPSRYQSPAPQDYNSDNRF